MKWYKHIVFFLVMTVAPLSAITDGCELPGGTLYLSDDNDGSVLYNSPAGCTYFDELNQFVLSYDQDECSAQEDPELFDGNIGGFQFDVDGATISGGSGGDAGSAGMLIQASGNLILAFSLSGDTIPAGCGTLVILELDGGATGFSGIVISDATGSQLNFEYYVPVSGCMDMDACNYDADATDDDGSCEYAVENYNCDGNCTLETDCAGVCGGSAELDECDVCNGDSSTCVDCLGVTNGDATLDNCEVCDNDSSNDCVQDCDGAWGGSAELDECGVCNGDSSTCVDCAGTPNGDATLDNCQECDNDPSNDCEQDCFGIYDGDAEEDECGVCNGNNSSCSDCAGIPNGDAYLDECGICVGGNTGFTQCIDDCAGFPGGNTVDDECGICGGDNSSCTDCNEDVNGSAYYDYNENCVDGNTGEAASLLDCEGLGPIDDDWGGPAAYDHCYVCDGGNADMDCYGFCFGDAYEDDCGVCGGDNSSCSDCAGIPNGDAYLDECGICVGGNTGFTQCIDDCAGFPGGNTVDDECGICGGDNSSCADCAGGPNGSSVEDECGTCDADPTNDCVQDCFGIWGGSAEFDECDTPVCTGGTTGLVANSSCLDCAGVPNGSAEFDDCYTPVCTGGTTGLVANSSCLDCVGTPNGTNFWNECGNCVPAENTDCQQDCADEWGGDAKISDFYYDLDGDGLGFGTVIEFCDIYVPPGFVDNADDLEPNCASNVTDDCGVCDGDGSTCNSSSDIDCNPLVEDDQNYDCSGICDGDATIDSCGLCTGGGTGLTPDYLKDCAGECAGDAVYDNCGEECIAADPSADCSAYCDDDDSNDCVQDCADEWGGTASLDNCGTCDNDSSNDCVQDCDGAWGGTGEMDLFGACCTATEESPCIITGCDLPDSTVYLTDTSMVFSSSKAIKQIKITMEGSGIYGSPLLGAAGDAGFNWIVDPDSILGRNPTPDTTITIPGGCGILFNIDYLNNPVSISVEIKDENNTVIGFSAYFDSGCSEMDACNYNPYSIDDISGSCNYPEEGFGCDGNMLAIINPGLIPETYNIHNIYPNPFNPVTNIEFGLPENAFVQIVVYDIKGRQIATLMNSFQFAGYYSLTWDAFDSPSGVYFINMTSDGFKQTRQVVLMK